MAAGNSPRSTEPGTALFEDRFRRVETAVAFRRITCYRCDLTAIYKYKVRQVRRKPEIELHTGDEIRPDHRWIWQSIPRFAEIPETVKCKRCREVLGIHTQCIF